MRAGASWVVSAGTLALRAWVMKRWPYAKRYPWEPRETEHPGWGYSAVNGKAARVFGVSLDAALYWMLGARPNSAAAGKLEAIAGIPRRAWARKGWTFAKRDFAAYVGRTAGRRTVIGVAPRLPGERGGRLLVECRCGSVRRCTIHRFEEMAVRPDSKCARCQTASLAAGGRARRVQVEADPVYGKLTIEAVVRNERRETARGLRTVVIVRVRCVCDRVEERPLRGLRIARSQGRTPMCRECLIAMNKARLLNARTRPNRWAEGRRACLPRTSSPAAARCAGEKDSARLHRESLRRVERGRCERAAPAPPRRAGVAAHGERDRRGGYTRGHDPAPLRAPRQAVENHLRRRLALARHLLGCAHGGQLDPSRTRRVIHARGYRHPLRPV